MKKSHVENSHFNCYKWKINLFTGQQMEMSKHTHVILQLCIFN